jgi:5'-methylthioadenosine phosphorylase
MNWMVTRRNSIDTTAKLGVITGSSFPAPALFDVEERRVDAPSGPFGPPTPVTVFEGDGIVVLPRHGHTTHTLPHSVDHRANLQALIDCGVDRIVALGSSGSLRLDWPIGTIVQPDDLFAPWTNPTWFDDPRAHISPQFDPAWRAAVRASWSRCTDTPLVDGGTYVQTIGPRFESRAEIRFYATVADLVGMTIADEALLAQQAGVAYSAICPIDNLANGLAADPLTFDSFKAGVATNATTLAEAVRSLATDLATAGGADERARH